MDDFKQNHKRLWQLVEYLFSGGIYFIVGYVFLDVFFYVWHWSLWWATIISSVIGWIANYLMQRYWVFKNSELAGRQTEVTGRYAFITIVDFLLNYLILLALKGAGIGPAIGQFISAGFFTGWNYAWYRFWVFPTRADKLIFKAGLARMFIHRAHGHSAYTNHER